MSQLIEVKVPDIGDFSDVDVIEVLVSEGDQIKVDDSLITVESDKASMEIPSTHAGTIKKLEVKVGDQVNKGSVLLQLEENEASGGGSSSEANNSSAETESPQKEESSQSAPQKEDKQDKTDDSSETQIIEVKTPDIGDFDEVDVIEVMVSEGDSIDAEQSLITVESDKASMEIPSSHAGKIVSLKVSVGDKISEGSVILELETTSSDATQPNEGKLESTPVTEDTSADTKEVSETVTASTAGLSSSQKASPTASYALSAKDFKNLPHASPSVRKFARELGVDLAQVEGTGRKNRIIQDDVRNFVKAALSVGTTARQSTPLGGQGGGLSVLDWPKIDFSKFGPTETKPLSRIQKISGANLHRNWVMIPHVTNNDEADITELENFRKQLNKEYQSEGIKFTMLAFLIKAAVMALKKFPIFNSSIDNEELVLKQYYNIGFAADTPHGLVVPVIKDADKKSISDLAQETATLAKTAREGKLSPTQMQGGCFSISSLGGIGGTDFTPIINAPEVAILGVSRSFMKPVWNGENFEPRLTLPLSLSYDHRVIDGAAAARFNVYLASLLADFRRAMI